MEKRDKLRRGKRSATFNRCALTVEIACFEKIRYNNGEEAPPC